MTCPKVLARLFTGVLPSSPGFHSSAPHSFCLHPVRPTCRSGLAAARCTGGVARAPATKMSRSFLAAVAQRAVDAAHPTFAPTLLLVSRQVSGIGADAQAEVCAKSDVVALFHLCRVATVWREKAVAELSCRMDDMATIEGAARLHAALASCQKPIVLLDMQLRGCWLAEGDNYWRMMDLAHLCHAHLPAGRLRKRGPAVPPWLVAALVAELKAAVDAGTMLTKGIGKLAMRTKVGC